MERNFLSRNFLLAWKKAGMHLLTPLRQRFAASLVTQTVKNLPAVQETWVQFLGQEDPLEKQTATHSSFLTLHFLFCTGVAMINQAVVVSSEQRGDSATHTHVSILLQIPSHPGSHSSVLAWRIPRTEEPGGRHSMGSQRVGHD